MATPSGFALDDDFLTLDDGPPCKQTRSVGRKQCATRWLPGAVVDGRGVLAAGSWDDEENVVALWSVGLARDDEGDDAMVDDADASADEPLCIAAHHGCVLDMAAAPTGSVPGAPALLFTGSGAGGVACFAVPDGRSLAPRWREPAAAHGHSAVHGVCYDADTRLVAAATEAGTLALLDAERGGRTRELHTREASLLGACWQAPATVVTAGSLLQVWDVRSGSPRDRLDTSLGAAAHTAPQLPCAAAHPQRTHLLAAGASDGSVFVWDMRNATTPSQHLPLAHALYARGAGAPPKRIGADVWGVQFCQTAYGELLSCGADGSVQAWSGVAGAGAPTPRVLVQLHMPVNSIHLSDLDTLAAASDAEQLTFIDMRR